MKVLGFPTQISTNKDIMDTMIKEGMPFHQSFYYEGVYPTANTLIGNLTPNFNINRVILGFNGKINCTSNVKLFGSFDSDPNGIYLSTVQYMYAGPGLSCPVPYKTPLSANGGTINLTGGDGTTSIKCGGLFDGIKLTNDLNFNAKRKIMWVGDSIADGTVNTGVTQAQMFPWLVKDYLQLNSPQKNDARLVLKTIPGKSGKDFDSLLPTGRLYIDQPDIIFWQHGMNDAGQAVGTTAYTTAMSNWFKYKQSNWPNAILVYLGTTPAQQSARESVIATYRTAMANFLLTTAVASDPTVFGIDLSQAFDRTISGNYATTDTSGDGIHPGTAVAQAAVATKITTGYNIDGTTKTNFGGLLNAGGLLDFGIKI